ncbi:septum formation family protein [Promicromonospora iranensis]|uniref:Septum formation-related domain-containing protein n=1 Tax=Promicromonospora iranensis TaxID=1105144 RepID=A0ABU2CM43_9MICO|nr:septum formation family protein [Promicromonospora iranensis]MDR7382416.1 hypothetical protein [Promicromonospora iranensis]
MADTRQTPGDEPEPATDPGTADTADGVAGDAGEKKSDEATAGAGATASGAADDAADPVEDAGPTGDAAPADDADGADGADGADDADDAEGPNPADPADPASAVVEQPTSAGDPDDPDEQPEGPYPTRLGWVVAAFLLFWPLAIPALVLSMRTAEANGTGNTRRAKKSSVRALDFALGAVTLGVVGIVGLAVGVVAAPTYASSLPQGFVSAARSFVPPALAGPLGITLPDDGAEIAAPTSPAIPSGDPSSAGDPYDPDPYASDPYAEDPYAEDPYAGDPANDPQQLPPPGSGDETEPSGEETPTSDTTATAGAEIPDLAVGDCFDTSATSGQTTLYRIPVVPCTTAHGGEVYAETTAPDSLAKNGQAPTQQALWDAADAYCYPEFTKFVGMRWARSELLYWPIAPSEQSWGEGDRRILCVVESEKPLTGSLKGAER